MKVYIFSTDNCVVVIRAKSVDKAWKVLKTWCDTSSSSAYKKPHFEDFELEVRNNAAHYQEEVIFAEKFAPTGPIIRNNEQVN